VEGDPKPFRLLMIGAPWR